MDYDYEDYGDVDDEWRERVERFADPGGNSALHAASDSNPRNLDCPTCGAENVLTPRDAVKGYQCDRCADRDEGLTPQW